MAMDWGALAQGIGTMASAHANWRQASINRDWQERMSSSAHSREVTDLRAAGLNPVLSATGGRGASSPGGAQASFGDLGSSAAAVATSRARAEVDLLKEQAANVRADSNLKSVQYNTELERRDIAYWEKLISEQSLNSAKAEAARARGIEDIYDSDIGRVLQWINVFSGALQGVGNSARSFDLRRGKGITINKSK